MNVLILGASGFIGKEISEGFAKSASVYRGVRADELDLFNNALEIDLFDSKTIIKAIEKSRADIVINCAGEVVSPEKSKNNTTFTDTLMSSLEQVNKTPKRILICGSAAVYGVVNREDFPISENHITNAKGDYAESKLAEENVAIQRSRELDVEVVRMRIFNPLGPNMRERFISSLILKKIRDYKDGLCESIELNRLDSEKDYFDVRDLASAALALAEAEFLKHDVYNVGSGKATTNLELTQSFLRGLGDDIPIKEVSDVPEPVYAGQADISRLKEELGWTPQYTLDDTTRRIIEYEKRR